MSKIVGNMTVDFKLINQEKSDHGLIIYDLRCINNVSVLLLAWKCNFTSFKVVGPLKILKTFFLKLLQHIGFQM